MMKKILLLGGTGAMGIYLAPELLDMGYAVDVVSLDKKTSDIPNLRYFQMNAMDDSVLKDLLKNKYDGIVDFLVYEDPENTFGKRVDLLLDSTAHYIFLSSYRVYSESVPITENSPRLFDVSPDREYLKEYRNEYSLYKAVGENILRGTKYNNWSIIRPAITYSQRRFQLVTLEANVIIDRMRNGKTVYLPEGAMDKDAVMTWAGDVAKMIARLLFNDKAYGETFTVSTSEYNTWRQVAEFYSEIGGLKYEVVDTETYLEMLGNGKNARFQLFYDRMFNRRVDNSKILEVTGLKQSDFVPLKKGLETEYNKLPKDVVWEETSVNKKMDEYAARKI